MNIYVPFEESQTVAEAFILHGHNAISCDNTYQGAKGLPHYFGNAFDRIAEPWDIIIAFPPCTYLSVSGLHWNKRQPERAVKTEAALQLICDLFNSPAKRLAIENPIGCISTRIGYENGQYFVIPIDKAGKIKGLKPSQVIQPYQFNEDASKATCLWLRGLPLLKPTGYFPPRIVQNGPYKGRKRWSNQTDSGQNKLAPSDTRAKERATTYPGIAKAMAEQWGNMNQELFKSQFFNP